MEKYENRHISEMPLSSPFFRKKVERFLGENGLRMEALDVYCAIEDEDGNILAGAGISRDIIKCIAVASQARQEGLVAPLVSHLISLASARGILELKLFTKPENQAIFESLGFHVLASAPKAILMENGRGLERYCNYLQGFAKEGRCGVVVMNANPFTLGHQYLLEQASQQVDTLYVIPVKEDLSQFPYTERLAMIKAAVGGELEENYFLCSSSKNQFSSEKIAPGSSSRQKIGFSQSLAKNNFLPSKVVVLEGSDYQISAATFPTYFLKDLSDAAETQMRLDLDLFARHIAPALNASVRFVGSEPLDALTNHYNTLMREVLPIEVVEIPRLKFASNGDKAEGNYFLCSCSKNQFPSAETTPTTPSSEENYFSQGFAKNQFSSANVTPMPPSGAGAENYFSCSCSKNQFSAEISASFVRKALEAGAFAVAAGLCPRSSWPYLLAQLAQRALMMELNLPMKPGLVCPDSNGAHKDMDYALMQKGIAAIRPYFAPMALAKSPETLRELGMEAENAMLVATGGVNTHRGAIFCLGLALNAWAQGAHNEELMQNRLAETAQSIFRIQLKNSNLPPRGAMAMALGGYEQLFEDWLPYLRKGKEALSSAEKKADAPERASLPFQMLLLRIMSTLDDTCVVKRVGAERAQMVKGEAEAMLMAEEKWFFAKPCEKYFSSDETKQNQLQELCDRYAAEGISPGGAADMLALTIFIDSII